MHQIQLIKSFRLISKLQVCCWSRLELNSPGAKIDVPVLGCLCWLKTKTKQKYCSKSDIKPQLAATINLDDIIFSKTNHREIHKANIHERAVLQR